MKGNTINPGRDVIEEYINQNDLWSIYPKSVGPPPEIQILNCKHENMALVYEQYTQSSSAYYYGEKRVYTIEYYHQCTCCGYSQYVDGLSQKSDNPITPIYSTIARNYDIERVRNAVFNMKRHKEVKKYYHYEDDVYRDIMLLWRKWYDKYLKTDEWAEIRRKVIEREKNICQGCMENPIDEIHHLSYESVGVELLFHLAGLCRKCHKKAEKMKEIKRLSVTQPSWM